MRAAALTIVAKNYLPYARTLMASVRAHSPELIRIAVLVDRVDGYFDPNAEDFEVILSEDLGIPESRWFHFKYTILELSTAVKPYAIEHVLDRYQIDRVFYFDPDIHIYGALPSLVSSLDDRTIVLTPHLTAPLEDECRPGDLEILRSGSYNLGFIGVRKCEESARFLKWWQAKLYEHCVVDLPKGLFVDQRWIDLAPGMFSGVRILRDPGLNVAYWNIAHRQITRSANAYLVNGLPLCFFHFSGFDPESPNAFSRHQDRFTIDDLGDAKDLVLDYGLKLFHNGYAQCKAWPYAFGVFENGFPIPDMGRPAHQEAPGLVRRLSDPFSEEGYKAFVEVWNSQLAGPDGRPSGVTRLAYRIYRARGDVQAAMPDIFNGDLIRFMNWFLSSGNSEHNLHNVFVAPMKNAVRVRAETKRARHIEETEDRVVNEKIIQTLAQSGIWVDGGVAVQIGDLNQLLGNGDAKLHLSQLAKAIYESRPDLQRLFPDPCGKDGIRFLAWFLTYGAQEYRLAEVLLAPLRAQWNVVVRSLDNRLWGVWHRCIYAAMAGSIALRTRIGNVADNIRIARAKAVMKRSIGGEIKKNMPRNGPDGSAQVMTSGVNIIGYVRSEMGVGESVRCAIRSARSAGLAVAVNSIDAPGPYRLNDGSIDPDDDKCSHGVNLFYVNADQSEAVTGSLGDAFVHGRYNIGYWCWELEEFPSRWVHAFQRFDEIWTLSAFCQTAIARKSPVPVVCIPPAIRVESFPPADRAEWGIGPNDFVFLSIVDLLSVSERKNPLGVISAFRLAFGENSQCRLILKINHAQQRPSEMEHIRKAAQGLPVVIIDRTIDRNDVTGLIQMSDCLVSLHRSEGFGLTLAEAMYLSKPVIATGYSGNLDFTKPDNSFLVDYDLVKIPKGCDPYDEGFLWAEPRLDHAARQMSLVVGAEDIRRHRAERGRDYIVRHFAPESVGRLMKERLDLIQDKFNHADRQLSANA